MATNTTGASPAKASLKNGAPPLRRTPNISTQMMALGDYRFCLEKAAFQAFSQENSWRWASIDRFGRQPATQYLGPGSPKMSLSGTIYPHFKGGLGQLTAMRAEANKGTPLVAISGWGQYLGLWCIESISEDRTTFLGNGAPLKIDFKMSLISYGGDSK
jgi:phage protein U